MKFLVLSLIATFNLTTANAADMLALAGDYANTAGDTAEVTLVNEETSDLFTPTTYAATVLLETADGSVYLSLEETGLVNNPKATELKFDVSTDCDDPGCTDHDGAITIAKNAAGQSEIQVDLSNNKDVAQDMEETFGEDGVYNEETVTKYCIDTFGPGSFGYANEWNYGEMGGHANCEYKYTATLKKK